MIFRIDDYLRKKMDYSTETKNATKLLEKNKHDKKSSCNLPMIDLMLYKREDARLR